MGSKVTISGLAPGQINGVVDGVMAARESIDLTIGPPSNSSWSSQTYVFEVQDSDGNVLASVNPTKAGDGDLTATLDLNTTEMVNHFGGNPGQTKPVWLILWGEAANDLYLLTEVEAYYNSYAGTDPTTVYSDLEANGEADGTIIEVASDEWAKVSRDSWMGTGVDDASDDSTPADTDQFAQSDTNGGLASTTWGTIKSLLSAIFLRRSNNLSELTDTSSARTNLGLGNVVTKIRGTVDVPDGSDTVTVSGLGLSAPPAQVLHSVRIPTAGDSLIPSALVHHSITADGFAIQLAAATPSPGYKIDYLVIT